MFSQITNINSHASSAPRCFTWLIATSTAGKQETYSLLACSDKPGTGTLLPTDPAAASASTSVSPSASASASPKPNPNGDKSKTNVGAIVGGVIGGLVALLLVALLGWYINKQKRIGRAESEAARRKEIEDFVERNDWSDKNGGVGAMAAKGLSKGGDGGHGDREVHDMAAVATGANGHEGYAQSSSPGTDRGVGNLAYSVSSVSGTTATGSGYGASVSPATHMASVVEAPDSGVPRSEAPVEVAGTTVTRDTVQNRAELA